ncbi:MAG: hypothetical protein J6B31_07250 [Bacteroidaceae bacterium]|nr:hypothetical protein [Bacteroidaceae bacterium]
MAKDFIFSWAEDINGKMVHVDSVPNGLQCKCRCPHCHEQLLARHGNINEHGFAHHSKKRGANLNICYMVILYKLAEHILQNQKRIHVPSYYGIYKEADIEFVDVKVDSRYEREDKQPDVIATTKDNQQYLIEFTFKYKVQHKKDLDYHNLTCLEIDLSKQTLESLEEFLMASNKDRRWINNDNYFKKIEQTYHDAKVISESECRNCKLKNSCCAIKQGYYPMLIENNGQKYRICKVKEYKRLSEKHRQQFLLRRQCREEELTKAENKQHKQPVEKAENRHPSIVIKPNPIKLQEDVSTVDELQRRSCFDCENNLAWKNKGGMANCGCFKRLKISSTVNPNYAKECKMFKKKQ